MKITRLLYIQRRFEIRLLTIAIALSVVILLAAALTMSIAPGECGAGDGPSCGPAGSLATGFEPLVAPIELVAVSLIAIGAVVLGSAIVASEVESGTAIIAWTLGPSRRRWLLERVMILGAGVGLAALFVGISSDAAQQAAFHQPVYSTFARIELRAPITLARAMATFAVATFAGALLGRTLPALLLAGVVTAGLMVAADRTMDVWAHSAATMLSEPDFSRDRVVETTWRDVTTGLVLSTSEYLAATPPPSAPPDWQATNFQEITIGVLGASSVNYVVLESGFYVLAAVTTLALTVVAVDGRRPVL